METVTAVLPGELVLYERGITGPSLFIGIGEPTASMVVGGQRYACVLWWDVNAPENGAYFGTRCREASRGQDATLWRP